MFVAVAQAPLSTGAKQHLPRWPKHRRLLKNMKQLKYFVVMLSQLIPLFVLPLSAHAADFEFKMDLAQKPAGSFYVSGVLNGEETVDLLVDTGADMIILSVASFRSLQKSQDLKSVRRMAARMADGRSKAVNIYRIESLLLGESCHVGPVEVAVVPGAANNILGLNVLNQAAPFAIYNSPPTLALSVCSQAVKPTSESGNSEFLAAVDI
jgi:predicted aspartyl protease